MVAICLQRLPRSTRSSQSAPLQISTGTSGMVWFGLERLNLTIKVESHSQRPALKYSSLSSSRGRIRTSIRFGEANLEVNRTRESLRSGVCGESQDAEACATKNKRSHVFLPCNEDAGKQHEDCYHGHCFASNRTRFGPFRLCHFGISQEMRPNL